MSVLANYLESEGVATALVSLVRHQSDPGRPPRVLWVPFELGRPLGEPRDAAFQRDVLGALVDLLSEPAGPVLREFETQAPSGTPNPAWQPPALNGADSVAAELDAIASDHAEFVERVGHTTVGVSGLTLDDAADYVTRGFDAGERPAGAPERMSPMVLFRFAADDLKAHYLEAASRGRCDAASRQLQDWMWNETHLGQSLKAFAEASVDCGSHSREVTGGRFLVPRDWR